MEVLINVLFGLSELLCAQGRDECRVGSPGRFFLLAREVVCVAERTRRRRGSYQIEIWVRVSVRFKLRSWVVIMIVVEVR